MCEGATWKDQFYVIAVIREPLPQFIGSTGEPRGLGSHNDYNMFDRQGSSIKVLSTILVCKQMPTMS